MGERYPITGADVAMHMAAEAYERAALLKQHAATNARLRAEEQAARCPHCGQWLSTRYSASQPHQCVGVGNGMGGAAGTSEVNAVNRDALARLVNLPEAPAVLSSEPYSPHWRRPAAAQIASEADREMWSGQYTHFGLPSASQACTICGGNCGQCGGPCTAPPADPDHARGAGRRSLPTERLAHAANREPRYPWPEKRQNAPAPAYARWLAIWVSGVLAGGFVALLAASLMYTN
jgi:hypothetical protein